MTEAVVTFPRLRALMAAHGMTFEKMAEVLGDSRVTFGRKINGAIDFGYTDMLKTKDFFVSKGEQVTIEYIFFDTGFTIVNKAGGDNCAEA